MKKKLRKRGWLAIAACLLGASAVIFWMTEKGETKPDTQRENSILTKKAVEKLSKQAHETLKLVASSGGSAESEKKMNHLMSQIHQYKVKEDAKGQYINKLHSSLQAVDSYRERNTDEKAFGRVYPSYLSALAKLKKAEPSLRLKEIDPYVWFYAAAANYERGQKKPGEITLSMVGDNSFGTYPEAPKHLQFDYVFEKNKGDNQYVYKNSLPWFRSDDYTVINAESAFTTKTKAQDKLWRIKSHPKYAAFLPASGIEAANLANNYTMDYFEAGYRDTLKAFKKQDVAVFNEGMPLIEQINDIETVFLGYDYRYRKSDDSYLKNIVRDVKKYKRKDNLVIVNMHWGIEYMETPAFYQTKFGRAALDAGADIIIGHHPHRLQSVEKYKGKYIVYSMGDYAFGADPTLKSRQTAIFRLKFAKEGGAVVMKGLRIAPVLENSNGSEAENNYQPLPVFGEKAREIVKELTRISRIIPNGVREFDYFDPFLEKAE